MTDIIIFFLLSLSIILICYRYVLGVSFRLLKHVLPQKFVYDIEVKKDYTWQPMVSFMIPCFNEGEHIYKTIESLLAQDWPKDKLEIIVIDDRSSDDSYQWALKAKALGNVTVLKNEVNTGKRKILIHATQIAKGEICVSVDSDVILAPSALKELMCCFPKNPKIVAVGGKVDISNANQNWVTQIQTMKLFFAYELYKGTENIFRSVMCLSGCLTAYRREALLKIEHLLENRQLMGMDIKYGEDRYLAHLLILQGGQSIINLDSRCWTKSPATLNQLFAQQLRWRRSNVVDWILSIKTLKAHLTKVNFIVIIYHWLLMLYILAYPLIIIHAFSLGLGLKMIVIHQLFLLTLAIAYQVVMFIRKEPLIKNPLVYLAVGVVLPISYFLLTPLAIFTLDSTSWETRKD
jgi:N-acetylglucosaminyltransferase